MTLAPNASLAGMLLVIPLLCSCGDEQPNDGGAAGAPSPDGSGTGGGNSGGSPDEAGGGGNGGGGGTSAGGPTLAEEYPGDANIADDPAVLFHDDFENGWGKWDFPTEDTQYLHLEQDAALAHGGTGYLRSTVTTADLQEDEYISSSTRWDFSERVDTVFIRYLARFRGISVPPHHWVRVAAGIPSFSQSGLANTVPSGDEGFWFDFDVSTDDVFNFYVYWHAMRSGQCNDGSATPDCEGDQGSTYYYGNVFRPTGQTPFSRDEWICLEMQARANAVDSSDGALAFWVNDELVGEYGPGYPDGTWLRATFHEGGCDFSACTDPAPFEGFDFRTDPDVLFKSVFLDAYYERNSTAEKRATLEDRGLTVLDEQTIYYDDVVIATERIGCPTK